MTKVMIQLEKWQITQSSDKRNLTLQRFIKGSVNKRTGEPGPDHWVDVGYYGKLEHLVNALIHKEFEIPSGTLVNQLKDILVELKRVENSLVEQIKR